MVKTKHTHKKYIIILTLTILSLIICCSENNTNNPHSSPSIEFTSVPVYTNWGTINGIVNNINTNEYNNYKVALFIFVSGWYNKPNWTVREISISNDGTWAWNISHINDTFATKFAAFLVTNGTSIPKMEGQADFPESFVKNTITNTISYRYPSTKNIQFSGYTWHIKSGLLPQGPGQNLFTDSTNAVWVDNDGKLHLKVIKTNNIWYCTEICMTNKALGYGKYIFYLSCRVDNIDENMDLGLFLFDYETKYPHREFDIEFMNWRDDTNNICYVVQPYTNINNEHRFKILSTNTKTTHIFEWNRDNIKYKSINGHNAESITNIIHTWTYSGINLPSPGKQQVHINFWLTFNEIETNTGPFNGTNTEVILHSFEFIPE